MLLIWWTTCQDCGKDLGSCVDDDAAMQFISSHWAAEGHEHGVLSLLIEEDSSGQLCSEQFWGISRTKERRLHAGRTMPHAIMDVPSVPGSRRPM